MDSYYIACNWKDRKEDAGACTRRIVQCMRGLASCDPSFAEVSIVPRSTRKLPYRIAVDFETIKPFVERGRNRTDVPPRKIIEKLGYNISLSADYRNREKKWVINAMCGAYPQTSGMLNYCKLSLPREADALDGLLQRGTAACLVQAMISSWDPDWAVVQGLHFGDYIRQMAGVPKYAPKQVFVGWMSYFADRVGKVPDDVPVHSKIRLEHGTLLVLTEEPITTDRPEHLSTASAVLARLQGAGLVPV
jgi:hypothetical protein